MSNAKETKLYYTINGKKMLVSKIQWHDVTRQWLFSYRDAKGSFIQDVLTSHKAHYIIAQ